METRSKGKLNVYQSIVAEYKKLMELGAIVYGEKLPSCRALALERGINPNTVGYIRILPKKGAYADYADADEKKRLEEVKKQLILFKTSGVTRAEIERAADEVYAESSSEF